MLDRRPAAWIVTSAGLLCVRASLYLEHAVAVDPVSSGNGSLTRCTHSHAVCAVRAVQRSGLMRVSVRCCAIHAASLPNAPTGCKPTWLHTWLPFATLWQAEGDQPQPQHAGSAAAAVMPATGPRQNFMAWTTARPAIASSPTPSQHLTSCRQRRLHHAVPLQAPPERTQY